MSDGIVVIGVGNSWAGDDAAGVLVARLVGARAGDGVAVIEHEGEPTGLLELWAGARLAVVVDATCGGGPVGTVRVIDATRDALPAAFNDVSTHAFPLAAAIELARVLGRLPERLLVVGVEGRSFDAGAAPGREVQAALEPAADRVLSLTQGTPIRNT
jgi:hydrogenase maturation protease